ncbi:putative signal peptide protein [Puccinia sorghi]|uniref:Putative signal peptide protein n=1 Tax=Puccinia sorghi TaxID=27349 RepID=A0A0L6VC42_9BASI|nr:putative signal peptide protein [Puccinia sorghi]
MLNFFVLLKKLLFFSSFLLGCKLVWAQTQFPLGTVPRRLGSVPSGLNQPPLKGHCTWHMAKWNLAEAKLLTNCSSHTIT